MSNTIIELKHSQTPGTEPSSLSNGEISINTADGKFYYKDPSGTIQAFEKFPGPSGLDGEIQFNDSGDLGANSGLTFDKTTASLNVAGSVNGGNLISSDYIEFGDGSRQYTANSGTGGGGGGDTFAYVKKTTNYTASAGDRILANTSGGSFTVTLPSSPSDGNIISIADADDWSVNNLIVGRNGSTIEGSDEDLTLDIGGIRVDLIYDGVTWEVYSYVGPSEIPSVTSNVGSYLYTDGTQTIWGPSANTGPVADTITLRDSNGDITANNFNSTSDKRLKKSIKKISNSIDTLNKLNGVSFKWSGTDSKSYGLIAQEVEKIMPELVSTSNDSMKSVSYIPLIALLIEAVKEQQKQINELKNAIIK